MGTYVQFAAWLKSADDTPAQIAQAARKVDTAPTEAQKEVGNYAKGHVRLHGFDITIETPKGGTRSGTDASGKAWSTTMHAHYGYIKRTESDADGDHVDVFVGPAPDSYMVFVIDQLTPGGGEFDEHKVMLGFHTVAEAKAGYLANYEKGWKGFGGIQALPMAAFKKWLKDGDTGAPIVAQFAKQGQVTRSVVTPPKRRPITTVSTVGKRTPDQPPPNHKPPLETDTAGNPVDTAEPFVVTKVSATTKLAAMTKEVVVPFKVVSKNKVKGNFEAEIADNPWKRAKGLSKRASLPANRGMLFDCPGPFWMQDVPFPLDVAFLTKAGQITDFLTMAPDPGAFLPLPLYKSAHPEAAYAVELPAGWCHNHGIQPGDRLEVDGGAR